MIQHLKLGIQLSTNKPFSTIQTIIQNGPVGEDMFWFLVSQLFSNVLVVLWNALLHVAVSRGVGGEFVKVGGGGGVLNEISQKG